VYTYLDCFVLAVLISNNQDAIMSLQTASRNFVMAVNCSRVSLCW